MIKFDAANYRILDPASLVKRLLLIGTVGLLITGVGYFTDREQFFHSYLLAFTFWTVLGLGGLFFTLLHFLTGSVWSVIIRRIPQAVMSTLPWMVLFFLPILFGMKELYHWSDQEIMAHDALLAQKSGYLNTPFFIIRTLFFFAGWYLLARHVNRKAWAQDGGLVTNLYDVLRPAAAGGMFFFAFSISFASFDWLMSLDAHWYSTIFGVYIFSGGYLSIIAFIILFALFLRKNKILTKEITVEHYHDLGKLLFAFTVFWAYIAGSQYFLIWYANVPEETVWFLYRWQGSWKFASLFLILGHFIIPFLILLFRASKRNLKLLGILAGLILIMEMVDLYWVIMPNLHHEVHVSWMDITSLIGIGGFFLAILWKSFTSRAVIPVKARNLQASINFINH